MTGDSPEIKTARSSIPPLVVDGALRFAVQPVDHDVAERRATSLKRLTDQFDQPGTGVSAASRASSGRGVWAASQASAEITRLMDQVLLASLDDPQFDASNLLDALRLLIPARSALDRLEGQLIMKSRERGLSWQQIAESMEYDSPQAAQQRFQRLTGGELVEEDQESR